MWSDTSGQIEGQTSGGGLSHPNFSDSCPLKQSAKKTDIVAPKVYRLWAMWTVSQNGGILSQLIHSESGPWGQSAKLATNGSQ